MSGGAIKKLRKAKIKEGMKNNKATMTTALSRLNESYMQRGIRWASNVTFDSTLSRMTPEEGYEYLRRKAIEAMANDN